MSSTEVNQNYYCIFLWMWDIIWGLKFIQSCTIFFYRSWICSLLASRDYIHNRAIHYLHLQHESALEGIILSVHLAVSFVSFLRAETTLHTNVHRILTSNTTAIETAQKGLRWQKLRGRQRVYILPFSVCHDVKQVKKHCPTPVSLCLTQS